jgi:hypothetical protein
LDITEALERLKSIHFRGGIFGKTTTLLVVLCVCVSAVCIAARVWWMALVLILPLMAMVFYTLRRCFNFAEKHPEAAIMEGAELLVHERLLFAQKYQTENPLLQATVVDHPPPALLPADVTSPDQSPAQALPSGPDSEKEVK